MDALTKSLDRGRALIRSAQEGALRLKAAGLLGSAMQPVGTGFLGDWGEQNRYQSGYASFRGWLYAAINALASEAGSQPVNVMRLTGQPEEDLGKKRRPGGSKMYWLNKMPKTARNKAANQEFEIVPSHPLVDALEWPNPFQHRWQFVYSFVANLNLTGWAYIVGGENDEGKLEFYSLPTTWVRPDHTDGPFSKFRIVDPKHPSSTDDPVFDRENVAFAHLPNPSDPLSALAPVSAQYAAIRIDDHIQTSQETFFRTGIFPSVVVTMGKDPHPDVPGGIRPRLTGAQRRQVVGMIQRVMSGVANYGSPAIVDGLIERIDRLSATQNEMGWDRSEDKVRTRILSAFCVHPYILGEPVSVGGYAQVANIERRFHKRVNIFLDMLSTVMSNFAGNLAGDAGLSIWWEEAQTLDPSMKWQNLHAARANDDISQNELRAELGYPPDEDRNQSVVGARVAHAVVALLGQVGMGAIGADQAQAVLIGMGLPDELAERIAGGKGERQQLDEAVGALGEAVRALRAPPAEMEGWVLDAIKWDPDQPREPAGTGEGGQFAGEGEGGGEGKPTDSGNDREIKFGGTSDHVRTAELYLAAGVKKDEELGQAIRDYTVYAHKELNDQLRSGKELDEDSQRVQDSLDKAMSLYGDNISPPPVTVYRGVGRSANEYLEMARQAVREKRTFHDNACMSSSFDPAVAAGFTTYSKPVILQIIARRGLSVRKVSKFSEEEELILPRGSRMRPVGIDENVVIKKGSKEARCTVIRVEID